ncbi:MAG: sugar transferase [Muribaculaceae bacterium]|nr:sugar transferase [Muribaculaceae bacterium]
MDQYNARRFVSVVTDLLMVATGWFCFNILRYYTLPSESVVSHVSLTSFLLSDTLVIEQFVVPPAIIVLYTISGAYNRPNTMYRSRLDELINTFTVSFISMIGIYFIVLVNDPIPERATAYELMLMLLFSLFLPTSIMRLVITGLRAGRVRRGCDSIPALLVGFSDAHLDKVEKIRASRCNTGLELVACIDTSGVGVTSFAGLPVHAESDIPELCGTLGIRAIIVLDSAGVYGTGEIINRLYRYDIPLFITPDMHSMILSRPRISSVTNEPLVDITNAHISPAALNCKRLGDIVVSSVALVVLLPFYLILALVVRLDSKGPVFYRQERIGYHKKPFRIIKFRSMRVDAEATGPALSSEADPRITRVGRFMRKYRLDELPQFWNVLKGEMSIVGPRPEREFYLRQILERHPACSLIHQVRPGITSWGMVRYGYASSVEEMLGRLYYDILYLENVSLGTDLKILFHSVNTILNGLGK